MRGGSCSDIVFTIEAGKLNTGKLLYVFATLFMRLQEIALRFFLSFFHMARASVVIPAIWETTCAQ
jgi:hypothetical protein